jgi:citrate lyase beta subunit
MLDKHRETVLALRVGATDLSAVYGLRRRPDVTLWDVAVVSAAIADIINVFGRAPDGEDTGGLVITGPVWEYFSSTPRVLRTQLRTTPFASPDAAEVRNELMAADLDGLIREALLDRVNGLTGKTVIHPSHIHPVHALAVVTAEEYADALDIAQARDAGGGEGRYGARNKLNEAGRQYNWARRVLQLADVFGVARPGISFVDVLSAGRAA